MARDTYKTKKMEERGVTTKEPMITKLFWKYHTMDEAITWTPEELENKLEEFYTAYEIRQKKLNINWWYPASPKDRILDLRYKKKYN